MSVQMVSVPKLRIYGVGDLNRLMPYVLGGKVATQINDYGKELKDLHKGSITLGEQAGLWNAFLYSELGADVGLGEAKDTVYSLFNAFGEVNVTDDACNYGGGIKLKKLRDTDRSVEWIIRPEGFEKKSGVWQAKLGPNSDVKHVIIPASGYVPRTCDGAYRPDTGTPFTTAGSRKEAEKSWTDAGYSPEFAGNAVSYFYGRDEGKGTSSVIRWYFDYDFGRFDIVADLDPDFRYSVIGALAAGETVGRAPAAGKPVIIMLREEEYRALRRTGQLAAMQESTVSLN